MTKYQTIESRFPEGFFNHLYRSIASKAFLINPFILMQIIRILSEAHFETVDSDNLFLNL